MSTAPFRETKFPESLSWVRNLDEVGTPILSRAEEVGRTLEEAAELERRAALVRQEAALVRQEAARQEELLIARVREQWSEREIQAAGGPALEHRTVYDDGEEWVTTFDLPVGRRFG